MQLVVDCAIQTCKAINEEGNMLDALPEKPLLPVEEEHRLNIQYAEIMANVNIASLLYKYPEVGLHSSNDSSYHL